MRISYLLMLILSILVLLSTAAYANISEAVIDKAYTNATGDTPPDVPPSTGDVPPSTGIVPVNNASVVIGDADGDGNLSQYDALLYLKKASGQDVNGKFDNVACDDVLITAADALMVIMAYENNIQLKVC
jgi:hypothetical protein